VLTSYHAQYYAHEIQKHHGEDDVERLSRSLFDACVDLNPHQIEAALFALRSPISKGVILADEVGLGKTIEAGVLLCQLWAEKKRKLMVICPASLRKQWALELEEKFNLPSVVIEAKSYNQLVKKEIANPFNQKNKIVICSYQFASRWKEQVRSVNWNIVAIDEAHKLRNVYRPSNKTGQNLKWALDHCKKVLLTATPLQNSLLELYGLSTLIDDRIFGDVNSFRAQYGNSKADIQDLKMRLSPFCKRTLRSQVLEYVPYTERKTITRPFTPTAQEQKLYEAISGFLSTPDTYALPHSQRQLTTLIIRKLLASSTFAVAGTLKTMKSRLEEIQKGLPIDEEIFLDKIFESEELEDELLEEGIELEESEEEEKIDQEKLQDEIKELSKFIEMAEDISIDSKSEVLLSALVTGFDQIKTMGAKRKALIFTESRRTQEYLKSYLDANGYKGKVSLFNGTNNDPDSKIIYEKWLQENSTHGRATGSKAVDIRTALIENFKDEAEILIATEAAAEGVNMQFCSLLVNYDLPWNPQRVEQRIGRCHRYGQKHDVVVINFINQNNAADKRVHQLLEQKFNLFEGVFGASDDVLGSIESGVDFEKRILEIYDTCRTNKEIESAFDQLQRQLDDSIQERMQGAKQMLFDHFDEEVHSRLKFQLDEAKAQLDKIGKLFWEVTKVTLADQATFNDADLSFQLTSSPLPHDPDSKTGTYHLIRKDKENVIGTYLYRLSHPLGEYALETASEAQLPTTTLNFDITHHPTKISVIEALKGKSGWLQLTKLQIDSLETHEELIFTAFTDTGEALDQETCQKLFNCSAPSTAPAECEEEIQSKISKEKSLVMNSTMNRIMEHNNQFFREEHARIDKWADDMIFSAEKELKDVRNQVKAIGRQLRFAESVEEQAKLQSEETELIRKRRKLRTKLDEIEDEIEDKARAMKDKLQARLEQIVTEHPLFTIRWTVC